MSWYGANGLKVYDNCGNRSEANNCPCECQRCKDDYIEVVIDALNNCATIDPSSKIDIGILDGTYRFVYYYGAVKPNSTDIYWNRNAGGGSGTLACYCTKGMLSGFDNIAQKPTVEETEEFYNCSYVDYVFSNERCYLWYNDFNCPDNVGNITYRICKVD